MAELTALQRYLRVQTATDRAMARILLDAAKDGERRVLALARGDSLSAAVGAARYALVVRELRRTQAQMWGALTPAMNAGLVNAGMAAASHENRVNAILFGTRAGETTEALAASQVASARATVAAYAARTANGIPLSEQVYKTTQLANGLVDREIGRGILLGEGWKQIAGRVKTMIRPDTAGGVSYAAKRLARTELNNAFHTVQIAQRADSPFAEGFQWVLSGSHPRPDVCNDYAEKVHLRRGEPGVFSVGTVPGKPHPNCLCYLTTVVVSDEKFERNLARGRYDNYLKRKTGRSFR